LIGFERYSLHPASIHILLWRGVVSAVGVSCVWRIASSRQTGRTYKLREWRRSTGQSDDGDLVLDVLRILILSYVARASDAVHDWHVDILQVRKEREEETMPSEEVAHVGKKVRRRGTKAAAVP
jgi:hypothetical protein